MDGDMEKTIKRIERLNGILTLAVIVEAIIVIYLLIL